MYKKKRGGFDEEKESIKKWHYNWCFGCYCDSCCFDWKKNDDYVGYKS